jgi:hypothetical protein
MQFRPVSAEGSRLRQRIPPLLRYGETCRRDEPTRLRGADLGAKGVRNEEYCHGTTDQGTTVEQLIQHFQRWSFFSNVHPG